MLQLTCAQTYSAGHQIMTCTAQPGMARLLADIERKHSRLAFRLDLKRPNMGFCFGSSAFFLGAMLKWASAWRRPGLLQEICGQNQRLNDHCREEVACADGQALQIAFGKISLQGLLWKESGSFATPRLCACSLHILEK